MLYPSLFEQFSGVKAAFSTMDDLPAGLENKTIWSMEDKKQVRNYLMNKLWGKNDCLFMDQKHTNLILKIDDLSPGEPCDAMYTSSVGKVLTVQVADCVPLLIYVDSEKPMVAVVHAGWRGLVGGIVTNSIGKLLECDVTVEDIYIWIGPSICQNCYEFGDKALDLFTPKYLKKKENKRHVDVKGQVINQLLELGLLSKQIEISDLCSFEQDKLLYSYRREGSSGRRMYGIIGLC